MIVIKKNRAAEHINVRCFHCRHIRSVMAMTCDAFPEEIPMQIWLGANRHSEPFPGDHGIQYELRPNVVPRDEESAKLLAK